MTADIPEGPYAGLDSYGVGDADRFFGRDGEIRELRDLVLGHRLVVVHGPSGIGTTSLIRAGVLGGRRGLGEGTAQVLAVTRPRIPRSVADPHASDLLVPSCPTEPGGVEVFGWDRRSTLAAAIERVTVGRDSRDRPLPLVLVVDQIDRVFDDATGWRPHRERLLDELVDAAGSVGRLRLVLAMRDGTLDRIAGFEDRVPSADRARFRVGPLAPQAALDAVAGPVQGTHRSFGTGVAEGLVDRLRSFTPGKAAVEPAALQIVCSVLWRGLPDRVAVVTQDALGGRGDVDAILTYFCAWAVADVAAEEGVEEHDVRRWLAHVVDGGSGSDGAMPSAVGPYGGGYDRVARALEERRVVRTEDRPHGVGCRLLDEGFAGPVRRLAPGAADLVRAPQILLDAAELASVDGQFELAAQLVGRVAEANRDRLGPLAAATALLGRITLGRARTQVGERAEESLAAAEDHLHQAAQLFGVEQDSRSVGRVLVSLGHLHLQCGRLMEAASVLEGAVHRLPGDADTRADFVEALARVGGRSGRGPEGASPQRDGAPTRG